MQMVLPVAEMIGWFCKGVGELIRQAGLQLIDLMMQGSPSIGRRWYMSDSPIQLIGGRVVAGMCGRCRVCST